MPSQTLPIRVNKKALFADLGYEPHKGQLEVHESDAPRRVLACGVRWGKTRAAAMEGLAAALAPAERSMGWVVAGTYDLADKVFRELLLIAATKLNHRVISLSENERKLVIRNLGGGVSEVRGKSADNPVSLLGEGLDWLIVDEASRLKPAIWESHLSQRLIDKKGWALLISTPKGKGWFYEIWRRGERGESGYASWNYPSWTNPHLDRDLIEAERKILPQRVFDQEYGAQFIEGAGSVFRKVREAARGAFADPVPGATYFAGLDLAKVEDFTVLAVMDADMNLVHVDRFNRLDWSLQRGRIYATALRFNNANVLVDSTGAGEPVYESLLEAGCYVHPYTFTQRSKSALIDNLAMHFEQGIITLPETDQWPEGIEELEAFEYSVTDSGNVKSGAPYGMHDDCVIALALACWQARTSPKEFEVLWL